MGSMLSSNEETLEDKLDNQLVRIIDEYQKMKLKTMYIAIFKIDEEAVYIPPRPTNTHAAIDTVSSPSSIFAHPVSHGDHHSFTPNPSYPGYKSHPSHSASHSGAFDSPQHSSGNITQNRRKQIIRITEVNDPMRALYTFKERQIIRDVDNIAEQEKQLAELRRKHGVKLDPNTKFPSFSSLSPMKLKSGSVADEKDALQGPIRMKDSITSVNDIKETLKTNDIISSVRSLGDTTDKLCEILDKAKVIRKMKGVGTPVVHIRGGRNTIFSYYLIGNGGDANHMIISYSKSESEYLEFMEWIKIQTKLEKLEGVLRDINSLLKEQDTGHAPRR